MTNMHTIISRQDRILRYNLIIDQSANIYQIEERNVRDKIVTARTWILRLFILPPSFVCNNTTNIFIHISPLCSVPKKGWTKKKIEYDTRWSCRMIRILTGSFFFFSSFDSLYYQINYEFASFRWLAYFVRLT